MWYYKYVAMKGNNMSVMVSKVDALVEMVRAYENDQIKRSNCIGKVLSNSIQKDNRKNEYSCYIDLDKSTKQYFPQKIRKSFKEN